MIPKKIENYNEFVYTLTPEEQRVLEIKKSNLKRLAEQSTLSGDSDSTADPDEES